MADGEVEWSGFHFTVTFDAPKSRHSFGETMDLNFDALSKAYRLKMEGFLYNKKDQTKFVSFHKDIN